MAIGRFLNSAQREALLASFLSALTGGAVFLLVTAHNKVLVFACGVFVATALFFWRLRFRFLYGLIELGFGLYVL